MYFDETAVYLDKENRKRIVRELKINAHRTIVGVYVFKNFDQYVIELETDLKTDIFWNALYYERLIDYIKISVAFETYNKAILVENGILVHRIKKNSVTKPFYEIQVAGQPVGFEEFIGSCGTSLNKKKECFPNGLTPNFQTLKYSETLGEAYQNIIKLDKDLLRHLKEINEHRNRLHFFQDFKGAFKVSSHVKKWKKIKDLSISILEAPLATEKKKTG